MWASNTDFTIFGSFVCDTQQVTETIFHWKMKNLERISAQGRHYTAISISQTSVWQSDTEDKPLPQKFI